MRACVHVCAAARKIYRCLSGLYDTVWHLKNETIKGALSPFYRHTEISGCARMGEREGEREGERSMNERNDGNFWRAWEVTRIREKSIEIRSQIYAFS